MDGNRPQVLLIASISVFILVVTLAYHKQNGVKDMWKLQTSIDEAQSEIDHTKLEYKQLRRELDSLNYSDAYVEAIARENLGLVKPGEVVYEFIDADTLAGADTNIGRTAPR